MTQSSFLFLMLMITHAVKHYSIQQHYRELYRIYIFKDLMSLHLLDVKSQTSKKVSLKLNPLRPRTIVEVLATLPRAVKKKSLLAATHLSPAPASSYYIPGNSVRNHAPLLIYSESKSALTVFAWISKRPRECRSYSS